MPILSNRRHERFAQELAAGRIACDAYVSAGYKPSRSASSRLYAKVSIAARVDEICNRASAKLEISLQWLLERLEEVRAMAMEAGQHAAAVSAIKELGILSGLRVERRETLNRTADQMSDAELAAIARGETPPGMRH